MVINLSEQDKTVVIAAQIIASEANLETMRGRPIEERLLVAMKRGREFWMSTDEDIRFRGSVAAVLLHCSDEERERINDELVALKSLSALISGVPVDFAQIQPTENPIGLMKMWRETK